MSKVAIVVVPYVLYKSHFIMMVQTILSALSMKHEHTLDLIAIVNGFKQSDSDYHWIEQTFDVAQKNDKNCLARAWNKGIRLAFERGADYVLVCNLDLIFHSRYLEKLIEFAKAEPQPLIWGGSEYSDFKTLEQAPLTEEASILSPFNSYLIDRRLFEQIGKFDEQFEPAYHEDSDMLYRIKLAGGTIKNAAGARYHHFDRMTIIGAQMENDADFLNWLRVLMDESMRRYSLKWGGLPGQERFSIPYGK